MNWKTILFYYFDSNSFKIPKKKASMIFCLVYIPGKAQGNSLWALINTIILKGWPIDISELFIR